MKSFTTLVALTAAAMAVIPSMAAPNTAGAPETKGLKELQSSNSPEFPDSLCGVAVEYDLPTGSLDKRQTLEPPNYWCCDGWTGLHHSGEGKRVCCSVSSGCCNISPGSVWSQAGYIKSVKPVKLKETDSSDTYLKAGKNCGGTDCLRCTENGSVNPNLPGWKSLRRFGC